MFYDLNLKLGVNEDAIFRRILGVAKDVSLIERSLDELSAEFSAIEGGGFETNKLESYLPKINQRAYGMKQDLEVFLRILAELKIKEPQLGDVKKHQVDGMNVIKVMVHFLLISSR